MKQIYQIILLLLFINGFANEINAQASNEFIENQGQWDAPFKYKSANAAVDLFLRKNGYTVSMADRNNWEKIDSKHHGKSDKRDTLFFHSYQVDFLNSNEGVSFTQEKMQKHYYNYYLGSDQSKWKHKIHPSTVVNYKNLYEGVDMRVYSENAQLKYDLIVAPNASVQLIKIKYTGQDNLSIRNKQLVVGTSLGEQIEAEPYTYQNINGERVQIKCEYILDGDVVQFKILDKYDHSLPLYIDPTLIFCSFTGSTADNWGYTATYDSSGNLYAGGIVGYSFPTPGFFSGNYPTTIGAFQTTFGGGGLSGMGNLFQYDATLSKFNATGTSLIYSTYLGGNDNEQPQSMIVDHQDNLVIAGRAYSTNFPTTTNAYDPSHNGGGDIFVSKFSPTGLYLAGTFVGGSGDDAVNVSADETVITPNDLKHNYSDDARSEVIVDLNNNIYVVAATTSTNFPTVNPVQTYGGMQDGVVIELNPTCSNLIWSTYLGGSQNDAAYVACINKINPLELYVAGGTKSTNLSTTNGVLHQTALGGIDGFVYRFNTTTKAIEAGTYIGTSAYDQVYGIQTDDSNKVYIMGQTQGAYPVTAGVFTNPNSSQFVSILNNGLSSILKSTVFGTGTLNSTDIAPNAFLVDNCENVYMSGWGGPIIGTNPGTTTGLPVTTNAIKATTDGNDFYFIVFSKNFATQLYGSFFGQNGGSGEHVDGGTSRFDANGIIYQAICARCGNSGLDPFPTTPGVWSTLNQSTNCNLAAVKIRFDFQNPSAEAIISGDSVGCVPFTISFVNNSISALNYIWDFGDGSALSTQVNPQHTYTVPGNYVVKLIAINPDGCTSNSDTAYFNINVKADSILPSFNVVKVDSCNPFTAQITNTSATNNGVPSANTIYVWDFGDGTSFTGTNPSLHTFPSQTSYTITLTMIDTNACNSPSIVTRIVDFSTSIVTAAFDMPDSVCLPAQVNFIDQSTSATTWNWKFGDGNVSSVQNPTNNYINPGNYNVTLISANPATCNKIDSITKAITILGSPFADFDWSPDPPEPNKATTFTNLSTGATKYFWDFGDGATSTKKDEIHIYQKDGTYNVCLTATNDVGCRDTVCKPVRGNVIPLADVPTGFSPNGDGANDKVFVKGYGIQSLTFRIFNRWGEKVFETKDKNEGWDGRYKGVLQEMEVYQFTLSVDFFDGTKSFKKGTITLLK